MVYNLIWELSGFTTKSKIFGFDILEGFRHLLPILYNKRETSYTHPFYHKIPSLHNISGLQKTECGIFVLWSIRFQQKKKFINWKISVHKKRWRVLLFKMKMSPKTNKFVVNFVSKNLFLKKLSFLGNLENFPRFFLFFWAYSLFLINVPD